MYHREYGRIHDVENPFYNSWLNMIGWIILILYFWYIESGTVKEKTRQKSMYYGEETIPIKMPWYKWLYIIAKCLLLDIRNNPRTTLVCCGFILIQLVGCLT